MDAPGVTPNFEARQIYLGPALAGINARYAHTVPGGKGEGIRIVNCGMGWRFMHEDLKMP